jgi:hypothetical protein
LDANLHRRDKIVLEHCICQLETVRAEIRKLGEGAKEGRQIYDERGAEDLSNAIVEINIILRGERAPNSEEL